MSGALIAALAALFVSLSNILTPLVYAAGSNALTLLALRYVAFALLCAAFLAVTRKPVRLARRQRLTCFAVGVCYTAGAGGLIASFAYMRVSLAILVFYTFPLLTVLLESVLDRRMPSMGQLLLMLLAFAGVSLALGVAPGLVSAPGLAFALLGAAGIASSFVWSNRALPDVEPVVLTGYMSLSALVVCAVLVTASDSFALVANTWPAWGAFAGAASLFCVAFLAVFIAIGQIGASRTAMVMNLEAVFTVLLAVLLLAEPFTLAQAIGAAVVVGAVVMMQVIAGRDERIAAALVAPAETP